MGTNKRAEGSQRNELVNELRGHVYEAMGSPHANYVIQKASSDDHHVHGSAPGNANAKVRSQRSEEQKAHKGIVDKGIFRSFGGFGRFPKREFSQA
eukprot:3811404-Amphidinium_carterae.1